MGRELTQRKESLSFVLRNDLWKDERLAKPFLKQIMNNRIEGQRNEHRPSQKVRNIDQRVYDSENLGISIRVPSCYRLLPIFPK